MANNKHSVKELYQWQSLPLNVKIRMSEERIRSWYDYYDGKVCCYFSGGIDSTVLLHMARQLFPNIKGVFVDTGLEYPEIREFVKTFDNIDIIKPKMTFKEVCQKYGYPFISKEVSEAVYGARKYLTKIAEQEILDRQTDHLMLNSTEKLLELANTQSILEFSRGGADNKYRKVCGLAEYSKNRERFRQCEGATSPGMLAKEWQSDIGQYP